MTIYKYIYMIAICWALRIETTPALRKKESAMVKLEATVAAREKEASAAQKKEADLQKRILAEFTKWQRLEDFTEP